MRVCVCVCEKERECMSVCVWVSERFPEVNVHSKQVYSRNVHCTNVYMYM